MNLAEEIAAMARNSRKASRILASASTELKNRFLEMTAWLLRKDQEQILELNEIDCQDAKQLGLDEWKIDRLRLKPETLDALASACLEVAAMPDPVGATECQWQRPNGLLVGKMRIPIGVIAMIYEARPGVTIEAAILAIKAGNAIILRGGSEAWRSNRVLSDILMRALKECGLPPDAVARTPGTGRENITELCKLNEYIDLIIPRGGEGLIQAVCEQATMPVLMHYKGVCHAYIDKGADLEQAAIIVENSKMSRPGVCNALECLLVHKDEAATFLPLVAQRMAGYNLVFRADAGALPLLGPKAEPLAPSDLGREFLGPVLAVVIVRDMEEAIAHIDRYGSRHTDIICTRDYGHAMSFLRRVDASMVAVNASTRFNDGGQLGLGAEIGISTSKLHAYGPMGVKELTTTKFVVLGNGQIRN